MDEPFDPALFVSRVQAGFYDGHLNQELARLSHEQLEQVALLLSERLQKRIRYR